MTTEDAHFNFNIMTDYVLKFRLKPKFRDIILHPFIEPLPSYKAYFIRAFRNAADNEYYTFEEFHTELKNVLLLLEKQAEAQMNLGRIRSEEYLQRFLDGKWKSKDERKKAIASAKAKRDNAKIEDQYLSLSLISGNPNLNRRIYYTEVLKLRFELNQAFIELIGVDQPEAKINDPQKLKRKGISYKTKLEFKDFFQNLSITEINAIQGKFRKKGDFEIAVLIDYLLKNEIIELVVNNKTGRSRANFYRLLKGDEFKNTTILNRYFESGTNTSKISSIDPQHTEVVNTITKLISKE